MQYRQLLEICIRGYGLYLLIQVPFTLLGITSVFTMDTSQFVKNPTLYNMSAIAAPIIHLALSFLLIRYAEILAKMATYNFKTTPSTDDEEVFQSGYKSKLSFCIIIIGLYFFAKSSTQIFSKLISLPITSLNIFWWDVLAMYGFVFVLSLIFVFKSNQITEFIFNRSQTSNETEIEE